MSKSKKSTIDVQGTAITILTQREEDLICLTDIARAKNAERSDDLVRNWLRNRNTVEFLGVWERLNNPDFNSVEFDGIKMQAGLNSFALTPKQWIERLNVSNVPNAALHVYELEQPQSVVKRTFASNFFDYRFGHKRFENGIVKLLSKSP